MSTTVTESKRHLEINATEFDGQLDGTIKTNTTATTQSAGDNSTKVATTAYADAVLPSWVPSSNPNYLTGINSGQVTTALGFTPYNATNPNNYITGYTVTQGDVTGHQAALSITESQISDLQSYLTAIPSGYATESYVQTQITNLVDSAPSTLQTLDDLAAALGDDANFSTTIATSIGTKLPLAGGDLTGVLKITDGSAGAPAIAFTNSGSDHTGIYRSDYASGKDNLNFAVDGSTKAYVNEAGIFSNNNVYFTGSLRKFGEWQATSGTSGQGFKFTNTSDSTDALTLSSAGNAVFGGNVTTGASLVSTNAIVDNVTAKTSSGNITFKTNGGTTIAQYANDLSATFAGTVTANGTTLTGATDISGLVTKASAQTISGAKTFSSDIKLNDNVEVEFGTGSDVKMKFDGADLITTVPTGSAFLIGTNGGTPHDNNGHADFVVDVNSSPQISFYSNQVQVGGTNMNWNAYLRYDGTTKFGAWDNDIHIFTQGSSGNTAKTIHIRPQAAAGTSTTVAQFNGDTGTTLTGNVDIGSVFGFNTTTDLLTITNNQNTGGINLAGGNSRIYFSGYRAIEGSTNGATLSIGEGYGMIALMDNVEVTGELQADSLDIDGNSDISGDLTVSGINYGLYHGTTEDGYYFDDYGGNRNLSLFLKNQRADLIRYQPVDNFEYWNGSAWVADDSQEANVKKLLDGRQDTGYNVPSTYYKFRFTTNQSSGWPTRANIGIQTGWSGSTWPGCQMLIEHYESSSWVLHATMEFGGQAGGGATALNSNDNSIDNWGLMFKSDSALHDGQGSSANTTRITIDFYGWTPSNNSYVAIPLQNIFITSNYAGIENTDYTNLLDHGKNATFTGNVTVSGGTLNLGNDVSIFDDGVNILRTDDVFHANNDIHVGGAGKLFDRANPGNYIELANTINISTNTDISGNLTVNNTITTPTNTHLSLSPNGSGHVYFGNAGNGMNLYHYSAANDGKYTTHDFNGNYYRLSTTATSGVWINNPLKVGSSISTASSFNFTNNDAYIKVGSSWNTGVLHFLNGATTYLQFDVPNGRIQNNLGSYLTASSGTAKFGSFDNQSMSLVTNNTARLTIDTSGHATFAGKVITTEVESAGTLLLDAAADITIDAGGADIILSDDAVIYGTFSKSGDNLQIRSRINNGDMYFRGVDNNTEFNALYLDMSNNGNATFSGSVTATDLTLTGNLNITGDINSTSVTDLDVTDKTITIAKGAADSATADGAGLIVDGASASLLYDHTGTQWEFNKPVEVKVGSSAITMTEYSNGAAIWLDGVNGDFIGGDYFGIHAYSNTSLDFSYGAATKMSMTNAGVLTTTGLDINGNADISGTLNVHDEIITTAGGSLLEQYVSSWSAATNHDILYQGWNTNTGDYIYLKSPGNSGNDHGVAFIGDSVIAFGQTDVETGAPELTSGSAPLDQNWFVLNSSTAAFAGTVTANGTTLTGTQTSVTGNAGTVTNGVYTTGNQTIGGNKTFDDPLTANDDIFIHDGGGIYITGQTFPSLVLSADSPTLSSNQGDTCYLADNVRVNGDLTVNGGDITLNGTGKITGIDTVTSATHAANKSYVDTQVATRAASSHTHTFASLTSKPTTISGYGITDAFDGAYGSLSGTPTIPSGNQIIDWTANGAGTIHSSNYTNSQYTKASFDLDHLFTLVGATADTSTNMGSYTSTTIPANQTIKQNIEAISTKRENFILACSDETSDLTTGTAKVTFRIPYTMQITNVKASLTTACTSGVVTVDINLNGSSIFGDGETGTRLTIDSGERTSKTAAAAYNFVSSATLVTMGDDAEVSIDIDTVGTETPGKGLKVTLIGYQR